MCNVMVEILLTLYTSPYHIYKTTLTEVLRGTHVAWQEQQKQFTLERTIFPTGKRVYCSCHPTWMLCKTSIAK